MSQPLPHEPYVFFICFREAAVAAIAEEFPSGVGDAVVHVLGDVRRAEIVAAVDDQRRLLNICELCDDVEVFNVPVGVNSFGPQAVT